MEQIYAQALWKMVADGMQPKKAVDALRDTLVANGRDALLPRIGRAFERIAAREMAKNEAVLTVAREKDAHRAEKEAKTLLKEWGHEAKSLKTRIDDTLIGGWRLEAGGEMVDTSHKKQLLDIYNKATAA